MRKARRPDLKGSSGCRSEDMMQKKLFLFAVMLAVFAAATSAQTNNFQSPKATRLAAGNEVSDPFGLLESDDDDVKKASGVRSSVVVNMAAEERAAFDQINQKRVENGLDPLVWSDELASVARIHSQNMAEFKFFSHRGLDNKLVSDRADSFGIKKWRSIGENIAFNRGYADPAAMAVELWLDSAAHRQNLLDPSWTHSAIGAARAEDGSYYFTQVFLIRK